MLNDKQSKINEQKSFQLTQIKQLGGPLPNVDFKSFNIKLQSPNALEQQANASINYKI